MSGYEATTVVEVRAWGQRVGAVAADPDRGVYAFEFADEWVAGPVELAPIHMPKQSGRVFVFPGLHEDTWKRLPPLLADSLPDDFGNALIDQWMARRGIDSSQITALDRLAYTAERGMGALTFHPPLADPVEPTALALADLVTSARQLLSGDLSEGEHAEDALRQLIHVGASAGGARAKAVVAYNPKTGQIRSGQFDAPDGFTQWLVKLDGAAVGTDRGAVITAGSDYGRIEYAYHLMAVDAGIDMAECRLVHEGPRSHFITRRFDRTDDDRRRHMLSLSGLDHTSYKQPGSYSYEQLILVAERLGLGSEAASELFRRCVFNVAAVNRDDHTKNTAFLCSPAGVWSLAPAFDLTHSYRVDSEWVARHQMTVNAKTEHITTHDLIELGDRFAIKGFKAIIGEVLEAVGRWSEHAETAGVSIDTIDRIQSDMAAFRPDRTT